MAAAAPNRFAATRGALPRKPLYLATRNAMRIDADGNHLILRRAGAPVERFPLARVDRIVCNRHADWSGAALAACLAHGIPLIWLDGKSEAVGSALPRVAVASPMTASLESYLELPDWTVRFDNWIRRRRLETLTAWALRSAREDRAPDAEAFQQMKRAYVYNGEFPEVFAAEGRGWCHALVVRHLHLQGLQARYWGYDGQPLELADQLANLLWAELNLDCGSLPAGAPADRTLMLIFETWARRREERLSAHLADLKRHLARENETWP